MNLSPWHRFVFAGWCAGWLIVAYLSLTPAPEQLPVGDKIQHMAGYALVTLAIAAFAERPRHVTMLAMVALAMSGLMELGQLFVPGRLAEWNDMAANTAGVAIGWTGAQVLLWLRQTVSRMFARNPG